MLQSDGSLGICLGCDELHAPAQFMETGEDGMIRGVGNARECPALKMKRPHLPQDVECCWEPPISQ